MTDITTAVALEMTLGERLVLARRRTGLSLREVADQVPGVSMSALAKWETDDRDPGFKRLARVARFYGVDVRWLVEAVDFNDVEPFVVTQSGEPTSRYATAPAMPGQQRFTLHAERSERPPLARAA
jgi:transcriptional regulator with XRE-family HTH domain